MVTAGENASYVGQHGLDPSELGSIDWLAVCDGSYPVFLAV